MKKIAALTFAAAALAVPATAHADAYCVQAGSTPAVTCPSTFDDAHQFTFLGDVLAPGHMGPLADGDSVQVEPGTYHEAVDLGGRANVTVFGDPAHSDRPVIEGNAIGQFTVDNDAPNVTLRHLEIDESSGGTGPALQIALDDSAPVTVDDVVLNSPDKCAYIDGTLLATSLVGHQTGAGGDPCLQIKGTGATISHLSATTSSAQTVVELESNQATLDGADITAGGSAPSGTPGALVLLPQNVNTMSVRHARIVGDPLAVLAANVSGSISDSVITASGPPLMAGGGYQLTDGGTGVLAYGGSLALRNITAVATGPGSVGALAGGTANLGSAIPAGTINVTNSILRGDERDAQGGAPLACTTGCVNGTVNIDHSNYRPSTGDGVTPGAGIQSGDPLFVNGFHLGPGSPAIDAGVAATAGETDLDGNPRSLGAAPDLGAFESNYPPPPPSGPQPTPKPSNAFKIGKVSVSKKTGAITIALTGPGAGAYSARATTKPKHARKALLFGRAKVSVAKAGAAKLVIKPTKAARRALKKARKLRVSIAITFKPTGGTAAKKTAKVTVKRRS